MDTFFPKRSIKRLQQRNLPFEVRWLPRTKTWRVVYATGEPGVWQHAPDAPDMFTAIVNAADMIWGK